MSPYRLTQTPEDKVENLIRSIKGCPLIQSSLKRTMSPERAAKLTGLTEKEASDALDTLSTKGIVEKRYIIQHPVTRAYITRSFKEKEEFMGSYYDSGSQDIENFTVSDNDIKAIYEF